MRKIFLLMAILVFSASTALAQVDGAISPAGDVITDQQAAEVTDSYIVYGEPMPDVMEKMRLSEAIQRFDETRGLEMQITGTAQPCAEKDGWVLLQDGGNSAKVILIDEHLTIPVNVNGKEITVFGLLEEQMPDPKSNAKPKDENAPRKYVVITRSVRVYH